MLVLDEDVLLAILGHEAPLGLDDDPIGEGEVGGVLRRPLGLDVLNRERLVGGVDALPTKLLRDLILKSRTEAFLQPDRPSALGRTPGRPSHGSEVAVLVASSPFGAVSARVLGRELL